jgi:ABC-type microcin C transport system duplicated ATPase subunit YejF
MLSASYENMSSDVVDLHAGGIPYQFPKGTRFATFYARQAFEDVKVTVDAGETLANKVGSELSGKVTVGATIKVVEASLETQGVHNWADEYGRTQSTRKEFTIRVPKPQLSVSQTTPKLGP